MYRHRNLLEVLFNLMKYILTALLGFIIAISTSVYAAPVSWDFAGTILQPLQSARTALIKGSYFQATSTVATSSFPVASSTTFCLGTDCRTSWPTGGGGGSISTSTTPTPGQLSYWTSTSALGSVATGTLTETVTGLQFDQTRGLVGGSAILSLSAGFTIPSTTDITNWNTAYASTTNLTPTYIRGLFSNTATGLTYTAATGITTLTGGYIIPTSASTTNYDSFHGTPSTRITAGNGLAWSGNTLSATSTHAAVTLSGALDYITLVGQDIVRGAIDLATDITGLLGISNGGTGTSTAPAQDQILVGKTGGTYDYRRITAGSNVTVSTSTPGQIIISSTATGSSSSFTVGATSTPIWRSTLQGWTFPDGYFMNTDIQAHRFHTIKPIWFEVTATGSVLRRDVSASQPFGYNASNTEVIKEYSSEQFVTVSAGDPEIHTLTGSTTAVTNSINTLIAFATSTGFTGIELDWEGFGSWTAGETTDYISYVTRLSNEAHKYGLKTMIYLPPIWNSAANSESGTGDEWDSANSDGYYQLEYEDFENVPVDYLLIAVYDYHFDYGAGRPNAPLKWQDDIISYAKRRISDHDRLIIGIPAAGYGGATGGFSFTAYTYASSTNITGFSGATRDAESGELTWTNGGNSYFVSDDESINIKRLRAEENGISKVSIWHIGGNRYGSGRAEPTLQEPTQTTQTDLKAHGESNGFIARFFSSTGSLIASITDSLFNVTSTSTLATTTISRLTVTGGLLDSTASIGTSGMLLQSTGTSTRWVATSTLGISGGSGTVYLATTSPWTNGNVAYVTGAGTVGSVATGTLTETVTGLQFDQTRALLGGSAILSLTAGFTIPSTTDITNWNSAFSWGNHASAGYLTSASIDTSSELRAILGDEAGSGPAVFASSTSLTSPTLFNFFGTPCSAGEFLTDIADNGAFTCTAGGGGGGGGSLSTSTDIIGAPGTVESLSYVSEDFLIGGSSSTTAEFQFDPDGGQLYLASTSNSNATATIESSNSAQAVRIGDDSGVGIEWIFSTAGRLITRFYGAITEWFIEATKVAITGKLFVATTTYNGATTTDALVVDGYTNSGEWIQEFCTTPIGETTQVVADTLRGCGRYIYIEDANGAIDFNSPLSASSTSFLIRPGATGITAVAGDGMGIGFGTGLYAVELYRNVPAMEWAMKQAPSTSTLIVAGLTDKLGVSADFATEPGAGYYVVGSSTTANWQLACNPSSGATTYVNTNIATSSTSVVGNNPFVHFRLEISGSSSTTISAILKARTDSNRNMTEVASCSASQSGSVSRLAPTAAIGKISAGSSPSLYLTFLKFWYKNFIF